MSLYTLSERFSRIVGYNVTALLSDYISFMDNESSFIISYFEGEIKEQPTLSFSSLNRLKLRFKELIDKISSSSKKMTEIAYFDMVEGIEDAYGTLILLEKYGKFSKTNKVNSEYVYGQEISTTLNQGQSIEKLMTSFGFDDTDNRWIDVAVNNQMVETSYSNDGGVGIKVPLNGKKNSFVSEGVIDYQSELSVYGKDISKNLSFKGSDLAILEYKDTMLQSAGILSGMVKGDNPEFPEDGVDPYVIENTMSSQTSYPSIVRQLTATFSNDDCFSSVSISKMEKVDDTITMNIDVTTVLGETVSNKLKI